MAQRDTGVVAEDSIADSRYQDLMEQPLKCIEDIYQHFGMTLSSSARSAMETYLEAKPKGKFGKHQYDSDERRSKERPLFARYQQRFAVPDEM